MSPLLRRSALLPFTLLMLASACGGGSTGTDRPPSPGPAQPSAPAPADTAWSWQLPAGFAPPVVPADNPMSGAKLALGRALFYETRLSGNNTLSCAGCHAPNLAFADGRAVARGATGQNHPRNAPGLINVAYQATHDWANPEPRTLEQQMHTPLFGDEPVELGVNDGNRATILQRLRDDAHYPAQFARVFQGDAAPLNWDNVIKAIATFERTLISADSRYDRARAGTETLTASEQRGQALFFGTQGQAQCVQCHAGPNLGGGAFVDIRGATGAAGFYNIGLFNTDGQGAYPARNQGLLTTTGQAQDMGKFRAPSLRNVAVTAPYLHDGSADTLAAVVAIHADGGRMFGPWPYAGDGRTNPFKDPLIDQIRIDAQEQVDLIAFLRTLTDTTALARPDFAAP